MNARRRSDDAASITPDLQKFAFGLFIASVVTNAASFIAAALGKEYISDKEWG